MNLLAHAAFKRWMDEQGLADGAIGDVEAIGGGTQNVMLRFRRGREEFVLRRGPSHLRRGSNAAMRREIRVLRALSDSDVPCPQLVAACLDKSVMDGAVFYLMAPVDGFNATAALPALHAGDLAVRHAMGIAAVDALAALGAVDLHAVGLADLGRPDGFLDRQVPRWLAELESYRVLAGYPGRDIPGVEHVADWLARNRPRRWSPGLMHGDYHLANLMFAHDGPRVAAIVDWEMCTVGDPLLDLGWLLVTWPNETEPTDAISGALGAAGGLPAPEALVARYAERSTRDLSSMPWYVVLAAFKLGILLEGTYARACAGRADPATGEALHEMALSLLRRAETLAESASLS